MPNIYKIPCIVGPTAVGKTEHALNLAKEMIAEGAHGIDLISVDSKQVFQGLETLTGADVPAGWRRGNSDHLPTLPNFFVSPDQKIQLHGVSIINTDQSWSLMNFRQLFWQIVNYSQENNRKIIMVGGTGLYYQRTFVYDQPNVGPNQAVRKKSKTMSLPEIQQWLEKLDSQQLSQMNNSDKNNPRRLIRAIERALSKKSGQVSQSENMTNTQSQPDYLYQPDYLGLKVELETLQTRITKRVSNRFDQAAQEVQKLISSRNPSSQALSTLGVEQLTMFLKGELTQSAASQLWATKEYQYAKRQFTWWKKHRVKWLDRP